MQQTQPLPSQYGAPQQAYPEYQAQKPVQHPAAFNPRYSAKACAAMIPAVIKRSAALRDKVMLKTKSGEVVKTKEQYEKVTVREFNGHITAEWIRTPSFTETVAHFINIALTLSNPRRTEINVVKVEVKGNKQEEKKKEKDHSAAWMAVAGILAAVTGVLFVNAAHAGWTAAKSSKRLVQDKRVMRELRDHKDGSDLLSVTYRLAKANARIQGREAAYNLQILGQSVSLVAASAFAAVAAFKHSEMGVIIGLAVAAGALTWKVIHYNANSVKEDNLRDLSQLLDGIEQAEKLQATIEGEDNDHSWDAFFAAPQPVPSAPPLDDQPNPPAYNPDYMQQVSAGFDYKLYPDLSIASAPPLEEKDSY